MAKTTTQEQKALTTKQVHILNRYELKKDGQPNGIVVYEVLSSNGNDHYHTTLVRGKASSCSCPATKPCYHMVQLQLIERERMAREEAEKRAAYVAMFDPCGLGM